LQDLVNPPTHKLEKEINNIQTKIIQAKYTKEKQNIPKKRKQLKESKRFCSTFRQPAPTERAQLSEKVVVT